MPVKKKRAKGAAKNYAAVKTPRNSFAEFLADPMISTALIVFGLIALVLSILEFTEAISL